MARMRIFAGPNGSGKTTLNQQLQGKANFGVYLNPDDLYCQITKEGSLDLRQYGEEEKSLNWATFKNNHGLTGNLKSNDAKVVCSDCQLKFSETPSVYLVSIVIDYLRHLLLLNNKTFSFETVFSHESKIALIAEAADKGYRTYLYFVCTSSADINVLRVKQRTKEGGHDVPENKIRSRYNRSLKNLSGGIKLAYRTYLFDNSGRKTNLIAEVTPGKHLIVSTSRVPLWFQEHILPLFS